MEHVADPKQGEKKPMTENLAMPERIYRKFTQMIQNQAIASIKVQDICRQCNISRTTFYYYFCDIYAIGTWKIEQIMGDSIFQIGEMYSWYKGHYLFFVGLEKERAFFQSAFFDRTYNSALEHGYRIASNKYQEILPDPMQRQFTPDERFQLDYLVRALSMMTAKWGSEGMTVPPKRMAELFEDHIPGFLKQLCP